MKIKELLIDESKWTKQFLALNKNEHPVNPRAYTAVKWCLLGAIEKCYENEELPNIYKKIRSKLGWYISLPYWNDMVSFNEIRKLVNELDI